MMKSVKINLALQGGGAHGAFTWGVLDRLLEETWLSVEGLSGASAGAMNALMFAEGWRLNGREGARDKLAEFWMAIARNDKSKLLSGSWEHSATKWWLNTMRYVSPYDVNILDLNPLRDLLIKLVDFESLQQSVPFKLFIAATEVNSGKLKIFRESELAVEHMLASACLPTIHRAVEIEGQHYWDGGFSANPAIFPLVYDCDADDVVIVLLQPLNRDELPVTAEAIAARVTEMSFQSTFMREMRAIAMIKSLVEDKRIVLGSVERRIKGLRTHIVQDEVLLAGMDRYSAFDTRASFLVCLKQAGRESASAWLQQYQQKLGVEATCDINALFA